MTLTAGNGSTPKDIGREPKEKYLAEFSAAEKDLPGRGLAWVESRRRRALDRFEAQGFPTEKTEDWRFTPVARLIAAPSALNAEAPKGFDAAKLALCEISPYRLVFVNGRYVSDFSRPLPKGAVFGSLSSLIKTSPKSIEPYLGRAGDGHAFNNLNTAFFSDGAVLHLAKGVKLEEPVHLLFVSTGGASFVRVLIVAGPGSSAAVVAEFCGEGDYATNAVVEVLADDGSRVELITLQRESREARFICALRARQQKDSVFVSHSITLGAGVSRNDVDVKLEGEGADCTLNGLYALEGTQHADHNTIVTHAKPHGTSRELYKGVLDGRARAVFNGAIVVEKDAQKTSALVYNKNLLLSENAMVNTKPEFKINANDVQCRHGATIGQLSADALFYLRSRGLSPEAARSLLVHAFASEMVDAVGVEPVREALSEVLHKRLPESA
jgi:Fe-S cluster assembly protein SufD